MWPSGDPQFDMPAVCSYKRGKVKGIEEWQKLLKSAAK